ncbi:pyridoxal phosphate-dependent transferase [Aspergillus spectabilis]
MASTTSFFNNVAYIPPDPIFELTKKYNADPAEKKVNLGQGTYKDENGDPWILPAVRAAKEKIKTANHEYLPILGLPSFRTLASELVFGRDTDAAKEGRVATCQSLSGTGALHITGKLLSKALSSPTTPLPTVYITSPTWSSHKQIFESIGFPVHGYNYSSPSPSNPEIDIASLTKTLTQAPENSIFNFHASAHNPSGWDPTIEQWKEIGRIVKAKSLFPVFDAAYLGITSGDYDQDAFPIRYFVNALNLEVAVCVSFAKSMGLYGERIGLCAFISQSPTAATATESSLAQLIRSEISNPPRIRGARCICCSCGPGDKS